MYAREAVQEEERARAARADRGMQAPPAVQPGRLDKVITLLSNATKVSNAAIPLAGELADTGLKLSWKATKLFGKMSLGFMALCAVAQLGSNSVHMADAAIKAANLGVILLGVAGSAAGSSFLAFQGAKYVKDNIEEIATIAAEKAKLYLAPKPPKQKAFRPRPKFPDLNPPKPSAKPQGVQVIDPRELMMMQQLFGGGDDR
jgi:hypothetical protein